MQYVLGRNRIFSFRYTAILCLFIYVLSCKEHVFGLIFKAMTQIVKKIEF